jgi:hypothetical protein
MTAVDFAGETTEMSDLVWPERATEQAAEYFNAAKKELELFHFIVGTIVHIDFVAYKAKRALEEDEKMQEEDSYESPEDPIKEPNDLLKSNPGEATRALRRSRQELLELFLGRSVDNFQTYVVSIIRAALRKQPKILSDSKYELDVKSILDHASIESLLYDLVERKVDDLSYRGFEDLQSWCLKHGIPLTAPTGKLAEVIELIATRNLIGHNRGVVDQKYLRIAKASRFQAGERRKLKPDELFAAIALLGQIVEATDRAVATSFGLEILPLEKLDKTEEQRPMR